VDRMEKIPSDKVSIPGQPSPYLVAVPTDLTIQPILIRQFYKTSPKRVKKYAAFP